MKSSPFVRRICATFVWLPLFLSLLCIPLRAAAPADAQIKGALDDIQRFESQVAGSPSSTTVNRTLKLLGLTRQRLDSSPNKSHPSWTEADKKLNALIQRLQAPAAAAPAASTSPSPSPAASTPRPGAGSSAPPQMISQHRVRIKKLGRDIESATQTLDQNGPKPFQSADYVATELRRLEVFKTSLANFSDFAGDADVVAATEALTKYENMIAFGQNYAAKEVAAIGDVQASLAALDAQRANVPNAPEPPFAFEAVRTWLTTIAQRRQAAAAALQQLAVYKERAYLPLQNGTVGEGAAYDFQDVDRLNAVFRRDIETIDSSLQQFSSNLDSNVAHINDTLAFVAELDPADSNGQTNGFLGAGKAASIRERLTAAHQLAKVAVDYDTLLKREQLTAHQQMLARVVASQAEYETKYQRARELVRMPKAATTDRALVAIAKETLANPSYEVGRIRRLVINTEKVHREMKTTDTEYDKVDVSLSGNVTLSGTATTYTYSWDQFQVATAEPVGDTFFIFYNTLKFFTSGATTTPLNRWILADRIQGSEIPEANIDRD